MASITPQGVQATELSDYVTQLEQVFQSALGNDLSLESATPQGQMIGSLALLFTQVDELVVHVSNGLALPTAIGRQLADYGTLFSLPRIAGERSTVTATFTGTAGTVIPIGTRVRTSAGATFATTVRADIAPAGTVDVLMRASEVGPVVAGAGELSQQVDAIAGVLSVTNGMVATLGRDAETDAEYRRRYTGEVALHGRDALDVIRARVLNTAGVIGCLTRDNPTAAPVTVQGVVIDARSVLAIVQGGVNADVAAAIAATKPVGVPTTGDVVVNVPHPQGFDIPIRFRRVREIALAVAITLSTSNSFPATGFATIRRNLLQWFTGTWPVPGPGIFDQTGLGIGESLDLHRLVTPINAVPGHTLGSVVVTRKDGGGALGTPDLDQRYILASADITFTISN